MATFTENYNLIKPSEEDYYDVTDFNENFDTLDTVMASAEQEIDNISEKVGDASDAGNETVFGKLNQIVSNVGNGISLVKSIQRITFSIDTRGGKSTQAINTIDPSRCIVILERLNNEHPSAFSYVLNADNLDVTTSTSTSSTYTITVGFWIIEFY